MLFQLFYIKSAVNNILYRNLERQKYKVNEQAFKKALTEKDINCMSLIPKSDLHSHSMLGSRFGVLEDYAGRKLQKPPARMPDFVVFENYLNSLFKEFLPQPGFFEHMLRAAFAQAKNDGIKVLQMSIDSRFYNYFPKKEKDIVEIVEKVRIETSPDLHFIPQIGMDRTHDN